MITFLMVVVIIIPTLKNGIDRKKANNPETPFLVASGDSSWPSTTRPAASRLMLPAPGALSKEQSETSSCQSQLLQVSMKSALIGRGWARATLSSESQQRSAFEKVLLVTQNLAFCKYLFRSLQWS